MPNMYIQSRQLQSSELHQHVHPLMCFHSITWVAHRTSRLLWEHYFRNCWMGSCDCRTIYLVAGLLYKHTWWALQLSSKLSDSQSMTCVSVCMAPQVQLP